MMAFPTGTFAQTGSIDLEDKCPAIAEHVFEKKPKYQDYVTSKKGEPNWSEQYEAFQKAKIAYDQYYQEQVDQVEAQWDELDAQSFEDEKAFYYLLAEYERDDAALAEVKSSCWQEVMGVDEYLKGNFCHALAKPPTEQNWTEMLNCTQLQAEGLKIKLSSGK